MDSFIAWVGGKKLLRKEIVNRFPEDGFKKYVEVFGGAGWVLFYRDKHAEKEVYNDINSELVNLFKNVKFHPEAVAKELEFTLSAREVFEQYKMADVSQMTEIQRAARYLYLIKLSYGATVRSFGCRARETVDLDVLHKVKKRLDGVLIENKSFAKLIPSQDREGTLFYCDPPYHNTEKYYDTGEDVFNEEMHILLRDTLKGIKGKFILSYNDDEFIRELYKDFVIEEVERSNNLKLVMGDGDARYKELIIKNF
ncbi:DNA adenine methylase [Anaerotignum propionicum]|uniref:site-specific DNA-methyltransferase (adenine-specific) n=1 Tax=Anaerotignum propionicum DSM 1682 TaxID=991789 RepID=A0A0X1U7T3_ANAPI|nr:DNA adenine methylase [Anaerotignum propionicum]AMJ41006.1 modification methylase DpnIIA [Anaerotignum propionicum DSM 1682]SHE61130.1 DNA adenine methylase [[Clostridium] propionicum DSM 1682] [Anaerotignum propionicum DSM 1682]